MDSLTISAERWEGKILPYDDALPPPRSGEESKETASSTTNATTAKVIDAEASTFLENLGFDQEFLESDVQDDGEVTLKDIQVDCFRTLSGTWRVASTVDETPPHLQKTSQPYGIERAAGGITLNDLMFSDENQRPEEDLNFSDDNQRLRPEDDLRFSEENQRPEAEEEEDTMEATWNAISQGRDNQKNIKLKKSETWLGVTRLPEPRSPASSTISRSEDSLEATWKELRKTVTFNEAVSASRRGGLVRDLMSTSDEMKKRFDDFINNFNNHLRLQRQESEQRLLAAIGRGL